MDYGNEELLPSGSIFKWHGPICDLVPQAGVICNIEAHLDKPIDLIPILLHSMHSMQQNLIDKQLQCHVASVRNDVISIDISGWYKAMSLEHHPEHIAPHISNIWDRPGKAFFLGWIGHKNGTLAMIDTNFEECNSAFPSPKVNALGNLGESMQSSVVLAYNCAKKWVSNRYPRNHFFFITTT